MRLLRKWILLILVLAYPTLVFSQVGFTRTFYPTGARPLKVITADFNGDNNADLATANFVGNSVSVLLGNGNGTFQNNVNFPTGAGPRSLAAADFNGDGKVDLVTANETAGTISLLLGNPTGTFQAKVDFAAGSGTSSVTTGDFNSDGNLDVATANRGSNNVSILLGSGQGSFTAQVPLSSLVPAYITAADLNSDLKLDLVVAQDIGNVSIFLSTGPATFGSAMTIPGPTSNGAAHVTDVNGDGNPDLTVPDVATFALQVLLGSGTGTFSASSLLGTDTEPRALTSADLDKDGFTDLAAVTAGYYYYYYSPPLVAVFRGTGGGAFGSRIDFSLGWSGSLLDVVTRDFNNDGKPDLALLETSQNFVTVLLQTSFLRHSLAFIQFSPNQAVGTTSAPHTLSVVSTGSFSAVISGVSIGGTHASNFTKSSDTCTGATVPVGTSCTIGIAFAPSVRGSRNAFLQISSNGTTSPDQLGLFGIGAGAGVVTPAPTSITFGDQSIFISSTPKVLNLTNTGTEAFIFISFNSSGPFSVDENCPTALSPGASCTANVGFSPNALGTLSGSLLITSDTVASPTTIALTGNGIPAPGVTVSATSLTFGSQQVSTISASQTITVTAVGTGTLAVGVGTTGNFAFTNNCGTTIAGGTNCTILVRFAPFAAGPLTGTLVISTNSTGSPHTVTLAGTGTDLMVNANTTGATVAAGQSASFQITLTGAGGFSGTVTLSCSVTRSSGAPETTMTCAPSPTSVTVSGTTPAQVTVSVGTMQRSIILWPNRIELPPFGLFLLAFALWSMRAWMAGKRQAHWAPRRLGLTLLVLALLSVLVACGGSGNGTTQNGTQPGTYVATVTATGSGVTRAITFNVTVQ